MPDLPIAWTHRCCQWYTTRVASIVLAKSSTRSEEPHKERCEEHHRKCCEERKKKTVIATRQDTKEQENDFCG